MHCITFAFLTMFMHFRCVITILKWCVLVGLDWVEPMMLLILHVTCSCIFHAHIPSFLYILILICLVLFCVSLSLSLSLVLVGSMAPKWKFALSRNPFRSGASSFNSTPSHVRFRDEKAKSDFSEKFSRRGIHLEHQVILSDFFNTDIPTVIYSRGWESLYGIPVTCHSVIIQEFYSNMHGFDYLVPHFITLVQGTRIVVTLDIVSEVLHVLRVAHPDYLVCDCLRTVSKDELSSLFYETPSSWSDRQNTFAQALQKDRG